MLKIHKYSFYLILLIFVFLTASDLFGQKSSKNNSKLIQEQHLFVYKSALEINDIHSAIVALNYLIANSTEDNDYKDTLAYLYIQTNQFLQSYNLVKKIQKGGKNSDFLTLILAISAHGLNQTVEATDAYYKLYASTKDLYHGYALLQLQQQLKRVKEAQMTCSQLLLDTAINKATIPVQIESKNQSINVPFKAVLLNINGLLAYDNNEYSASIESFKKALEIFPDYEVAAQNLKIISVIKESMEKIITE